MKAFASAVLAVLMICALVGSALADAAPTASFIKIGTGGMSGVYYPTGGAICRGVNKHRSTHGIRCTAEATSGSVFNTKSVLAGDFEFGVVQSDVQWMAVHGAGPFDGRQERLRAVFSVHPETAILVVRADSDIHKASDIRGKRVNLGNPGSGQESTSNVVLGALGVTRADLSLAGALDSSEQGAALRDNIIDGFFYTIGHPNGGIRDIFFATEARLIPLTGPGFDTLVRDAPYYVFAETPGGLYRGVPLAVPTFALKATLVTSVDVPEGVVYTLVKGVFDDFTAFKKLHPAYRDLRTEDMLQGLSAPLHPGALRYYEERGWK